MSAEEGEDLEVAKEVQWEPLKVLEGEEEVPVQSVICLH